MIKFNSTLFLDVLFEDRYFSLIESSFIYLLKYLIIFSFITGSRKYITKLRNITLKKKNFLNKTKDNFIILIENILVNFNSKNVMKNLDECKNLMKNDYFMHEWIYWIIWKKSKKIILENYLFLNENVNIEDIKFLFNENEEETKKTW